MLQNGTNEHKIIGRRPKNIGWRMVEINCFFTNNIKNK